MNALLLDCKKVVLNEFPWSFAMRIKPLSGKGARTSRKRLKVILKMQ